MAICRSGCQRFVNFTYAKKPESKFLLLYTMYDGLHIEAMHYRTVFKLEP